ncbi:uncharacterized protein LOC135559937 isoform X2 [Oncorhynchus nerka]
MATQPLSPDTPWEEVKDAVVPRQVEVVKFGLRVLKSNMAVYKDSESWAYFLHVLNSPAGPPDTAFLTEARNVTMEILLNQGSLGHLIQIPRTFLMVYPDQALLLLVTQALALRILHEPLTPALPVLNYYKGHVWALRWLVGFLSSSPGRLESFLRGVAVELHNTDGSQLSPSSFPSSSLKDQPGPFWHYLTDLIRETLSVRVQKQRSVCWSVVLLTECVSVSRTLSVRVENRGVSVVLPTECVSVSRTLSVRVQKQRSVCWSVVLLTECVSVSRTLSVRVENRGVSVGLLCYRRSVCLSPGLYL